MRFPDPIRRAFQRSSVGLAVVGLAVVVSSITTLAAMGDSGGERPDREMTLSAIEDDTTTSSSSSTTSTIADDADPVAAPMRPVAEPDSVNSVEERLADHEARIDRLETPSTTTTVAAAPTTSTVPKYVPVVEEPTTTTTTTRDPGRVVPIPTTTTTVRAELRFEVSNLRRCDPNSGFTHVCADVKYWATSGSGTVYLDPKLFQVRDLDGPYPVEMPYVQKQQATTIAKTMKLTFNARIGTNPYNAEESWPCRDMSVAYNWGPSVFEGYAC